MILVQPEDLLNSGSGGPLLFLKASFHQASLRHLPELITASLVNASDPTRHTTAHFRSFPEAALCSAPLKICAQSIFDGSYMKLHRAEAIEPGKKSDTGTT